jgi:putative membrane protein
VSAPSLPALFFSHWQPSWSLNVQAGLVACLYLWGTSRVHGRWPVTRTLSFLGAIGAMLVALESGIDTFDGQMLSVHMVQHTMLLLVVPLLLIGGRPVILALRAVPPQQRGALTRALPRLRRLTRPWPALAMYFSVLGVTHLAWFYDATLKDPLLHGFEHACYVAAGTLLLWPLLDGDPVPAHRMSGLGKFAYMLAAMLPMAIIGAYLNRHATVVYAPYGPAARALHISAVSDQATAGAIMWVIGNTAMMFIGICATILGLQADERRQQMRDAREARLLATGLRDGHGGPGMGL